MPPIPVFIYFYYVAGKRRNVTKVYIRNILSKYLIISCLSLLNDDNMATPIHKWPQM